MAALANFASVALSSANLVNRAAFRSSPRIFRLPAEKEHDSGWPKQLMLRVFTPPMACAEVDDWS
eukprot:1019650-Alexandrium_andersonii.AAC.1